MKFGVREICDVTLRAKTKMQIGKKTFYKNEPVLYFDTLTASSLEGSATTVYAQGGKGNTRLMAWEGERTLTFNMTDALISAESFSVLSGADIYDAGDGTVTGTKTMFVHTTTRADVKSYDKWFTSVPSGVTSSDYAVKVPGLACWNHRASIKEITPPASSKPTEAVPWGEIGSDFYEKEADIFIMQLQNGEISAAPAIPDEANSSSTAHWTIHYSLEGGEYYTYIECIEMVKESTVLVDYYTKVDTDKGKQIEITPDKFGGYFYLEASTLFRDEATGKDMPAEFIIPNCKIQSNFTFSMSSTGDPSTFDFVLDAFPDYTKFDEKQKVLAVVQILGSDVGEAAAAEEQRKHNPNERTGNPDAVADVFNHKTWYSFGAATIAATTSTYTPTSYARGDEDDIASKARQYTVTASTGGGEG